MSTDRQSKQGEAVARPETTFAAMKESGLISRLGGVRGVIESSIPAVVFAAAYASSQQNLRVALWVAVATGVLMTVLSLTQGRPIKQAVAGFVGILIMAAISSFTGKAEDFFLLPILKNGALAVAYAVSIIVRWPLTGVFFGPVLGERMRWRKVPARLRAYQLASWVWVAMFAIRFLVQMPLYLAGNVTGLGIQSIALGLPLFLLSCWAVFVILARVPLAREPMAATD